MEAGRYPSRFMTPGRIPRLQTSRKMLFHAPKCSLHRESRLVDNDPDEGVTGIIMPVALFTFHDDAVFLVSVGCKSLTGSHDGR